MPRSSVQPITDQEYELLPPTLQRKVSRRFNIFHEDCDTRVNTAAIMAVAKALDEDEHQQLVPWSSAPSNLLG
jgi:hypothetical protein